MPAGVCVPGAIDWLPACRLYSTIGIRVRILMIFLPKPEGLFGVLL